MSAHLDNIYIFINQKLFMCINFCLHVYRISVHHLCALCLRSLEGEFESPETGVTDGCESPWSVGNETQVL